MKGIIVKALGLALFLLIFVGSCTPQKEVVRGGNYVVQVSPRTVDVLIGQEAVLNTGVQFEPVLIGFEISSTKVNLRLKQNDGFSVVFEPIEFKNGGPPNGIMKITPSPTMTKSSYVVFVEGVDEFGNIKEVGGPVTINVK